MMSFISKSLVSLSLVALLWGPMEGWIGTQQRAGLACTEDFSACRVAGRVIPLVDRSSVLGQIAEQARHDPAGRLRSELGEVAGSALADMRDAAGRVSE